MAIGSLSRLGRFAPTRTSEQDTFVVNIFFEGRKAPYTVKFNRNDRVIDRFEVDGCVFEDASGTTAR